MFSLSASSFVGTSVSASFKGTRDAFVASGAREGYSERCDFRFFFFLFSARLNFWEQKRGRRGGEEEKLSVPAF
jgi:hypothetical protein